MHTPAAALAWELWSRNRPRLIAIIGLLLGFATIYPLLCTSVDFNPAGSDTLNEIAKMLAAHESEGPTAFRIFEILFFLFLVCGPWLAMIVSLLCVTWMFTLVELDPKAKTLSFPGRLFTLPISTSFLSLSLMLSGMVAIIVLRGCWICFVRLPHMEMFATYQSCLGWLTLLALAQGLIWALEGWPTTRVLLVAVVFFCFAFSPTQRDIFQSPWVLPLLFLLGVALARVGMQKARHGQWQAWPASLLVFTPRAPAELNSARRFGSPARAQLWFEWRCTARPLCLYATGLTLVAVVIFLVRRCWVGGPLPADNVSAFACSLIAIPLFLHFAVGISLVKTDLPFLMNRPLSNGEIMLAKLKAAALSTVVAWSVVLAAGCIIPLLGKYSSGLGAFVVFQPGAWVMMGMGLVLLIFVTWRFIPASLAFVLSGNRRFAELQFWILFVIYLLGGMIVASWVRDPVLWNVVARLLPFLLAGLLALKLLLAFLAFRLALKRRLLSQSAAFGYLMVWCSIVAALLMLLGVLAAINPPGPGILFPCALAIVLFVPLARIGLCPITLSWNRHA